jgi:CheY-like chemotaxis protein
VTKEREISTRLVSGGRLHQRTALIRKWTSLTGRQFGGKLRETFMIVPNLPVQIYIVDDEPSVCTAYARLVRSARMQQRTFDSLEQSMDANLSDESASVISDVRMAGISGLELPGLLAGAGRRLPVIFVSAHDTPETRDIARRAGRGRVFSANPSTIRRFSTWSHGRSASARTIRLLELECSHEPPVAPQPQLSFTTACERKETPKAMPPPDMLVIDTATRNVPVCREWIGTLGSETAEVIDLLKLLPHLLQNEESAS